MGRIAGIVTDRPSEQAIEDLSSMIGCMLHEPSYRHSTYCIPELGCYLGWVSPDESSTDPQFTINQEGDRILLFAGEHFGASDGWRAASLLSMYDRTGDRCLLELNGWFAGALIDLRKQTILIFNDRLGLQRLYYTATRTSFAFSSEAKSLLAICAETRRLNQTALGQLLAVGAVLDDQTLFRDVFVLPSGSAWTIEKTGKITKRRYFSASGLESLPSLPEEEFHDRLRDTFSRVIPRYFRNTSRTAVSLTGGLDTRAIMAFGGDTTSARAYTYGGMYRDCFDVRIGRTVAQACGYQHEVLRLGQEFLADFPQLAEKTVWTTDGTFDVCGSHEIYLSRMARQIAPIRITGNYGSEILRSQQNFRPLGLRETVFSKTFLPYIKEGVRLFESRKNEHPVSFALFKDISWNLYGRLAAAQSQLTVRSPYTDNEVVSLAYQGPRDRSSQMKLWRRLIVEKHPQLGSIPTDWGLSGRQSSITALPDRLYKYLLFKAEWYYEGGMPSWAAVIDRKFGRGRPPLWFVGSHKIEHYRRWLRDELFTWVRSTLCDSAGQRSYLDAGAVRELVTAHGAGTGNFTGEINKLLTVELIHRLFLDGAAFRRRSQLAIGRSQNPQLQDGPSIPAVR